MSARYVGAALAAVVIAAGVALALHVGICEDVAWHLQVIDLARRGVPLYERVIEVNPPWAIWYMTPAVHVAGPLERAYPAVVWEVAATLAACWALAATALRRGAPDLPTPSRWLVVGAAFAFLALYGYEYGQREHLSAMLVLPYVVAAGLPPDRLPRWLRITLGAVAGAGFAVKPHYALPFILLELALLWMRRGRPFLRPEGAAAAAVGLAYVAAVVAFAPAYLVLAREWASTYLPLNVHPPGYLLTRVGAMLVLVAAALAVLPRAPSPLRRQQRVALIAALGFLVTALVQAKGWAHHYLQAEALAVLSVATYFPVATTVRLGASRAIAAAGALGAAVVLAIAMLTRAEARDEAHVGLDTWRAELGPLFDRHAPAGRVAALQVGLTPAFPLVTERGLDWSLRYPSLWMLQDIYDARCEEVEPPVTPMQARAWADVATDLRERPPRLILAEHPPPGHELSMCGGMDDLLARDPAFAAVLARYRVAARTVHYTAYVPR